MRDEIRRHELGKYLLDISKYVLTVVVIGALASERVEAKLVLLGLGIGAAFCFSGFWTLPPKLATEERTR